MSKFVFNRPRAHSAARARPGREYLAAVRPRPLFVFWLNAIGSAVASQQRPRNLLGTRRMNDAFSNAQNSATVLHWCTGPKSTCRYRHWSVDEPQSAGSWSVTDESYTQVKQPPQWVRAVRKFDMYARVIDYLGHDEHGMSEKFAAYLRFLGYTTTKFTASANGAGDLISARFPYSFLNIRLYCFHIIS